MGFKEKLRDKTRDQTCEHLDIVGIDAKLAERGIDEEKASKPRWRTSLGLIEIGKSPINYVHVVYIQTRYGRHYTTLFLCHDSSAYKAGLKARSKRIREFPLIGKVKDVVWEGNLGGNVIEQLNEDEYLKEELIRLHYDVKLAACPDIGYWKIEVKGRLNKLVREKWDSYEIIALHLKPKKDW